MMNGAIPKHEQERRAFERSVQITGLPINCDSIEQLPPPAPDIVCRNCDGARRGYDLLRLVDQEMLTRLGTKLKIEENLHSEITETNQEEFDRQFGNALLSIDFADGVTANQVRDGVSPLIDELLELPEGYTGPVTKFASGKLSAMIRQVDVCRADFKGPVFHVLAIGSIGDPVTVALRKKFTREYWRETPVELIAFLDELSQFPASIWQSPLIRELNSRHDLGPFKRIWVVDLQAGKIEFKKP